MTSTNKQGIRKYEVFDCDPTCGIATKPNKEFVIASDIGVVEVAKVIAKTVNIPVEKITMGEYKGSTFIFLNTKLENRRKTKEVETVVLTNENKDVLKLCDFYPTSPMHESCLQSTVPLSGVSPPKDTLISQEDVQTDSYRSCALSLKQIEASGFAPFTVSWSALEAEVREVVEQYYQHLNRRNVNRLLRELLVDKVESCHAQYVSYLKREEVVGLIVHTNCIIWMSLSFTPDSRRIYPNLIHSRDNAFKAIIQNKDYSFDFSNFFVDVEDCVRKPSLPKICENQSLPESTKETEECDFTVCDEMTKVEDEEKKLTMSDLEMSGPSTRQSSGSLSDLRSPSDPLEIVSPYTMETQEIAPSSTPPFETFSISPNLLFDSSVSEKNFNSTPPTPEGTTPNVGVSPVMNENNTSWNTPQVDEAMLYALGNSMLMNYLGALQYQQQQQLQMVGAGNTTPDGAGGTTSTIQQLHRAPSMNLNLNLTFQTVGNQSGAPTDYFYQQPPGSYTTNNCKNDNCEGYREDDYGQASNHWDRGGASSSSNGKSYTLRSVSKSKGMKQRMVPLLQFFISPNVKYHLQGMLNVDDALIADCPKKGVVQMCIKGLQQAYSFAKVHGDVRMFPESANEEKSEIWRTKLLGQRVKVTMYWDVRADQYFVRDLSDIVVYPKDESKMREKEPFVFNTKKVVYFDYVGFKAHDFGVWDKKKEEDELKFIQDILRDKFNDREVIRVLPYHYFDKNTKTLRTTIDVVILIYEKVNVDGVSQMGRCRAMFTKQENGRTAIKHYYNLNKLKKVAKNLTSVFAAASFAILSGETVQVV